ncbi:hypothetical protein BC628DRAFT_1471693 [Trametes gibbosa]|nr:hypothetical protein BC628DRAFT_1471693 [Trametes gibbosa]
MLTMLRVAAFALLVLSLFSFVQASTAARREATNAERLARGLGPARPKRLYSGSRTTFRPPPTDVARSSPSGVLTSNAPINVVALYARGTSPTSGASPLGWLGSSKATTHHWEAYGYQYTQSTTSPPTPVELDAQNDPGYRLGGVIPGLQGSTTLAPGSGSYVQLGNVDVHTALGARTGTYQSGKYVTAGFAQTTIFQVDHSTGNITVAWVNADSSVKTSYAVLSSSAVYLTGDVEAFLSKTGANPASAQAVDLYFAYPPSDPV